MIGGIAVCARPLVIMRNEILHADAVCVRKVDVHAGAHAVECYVVAVVDPKAPTCKWIAYVHVKHLHATTPCEQHEPNISRQPYHRHQT